MFNKAIKNIYFVQNFHGIQYFLSLYKPGQSNLVVIGDSEDMKQFLNQILPQEKKITVPRIPDGIHPFKLPFYYIYWRIYYSRLLKDIKSPATAYFFSKGGNIHFFILLGYLSRKGIKIKYIDAVGSIKTGITGASFYEEKIENLTFRSRLYLWILSISAGVKLVELQTIKWQYLGLGGGYTLVDYSPAPWEELTQKYNWCYFNKSPNAILLIDLPIQKLTGINVAKTQQNLLQYFNKLIDAGKEIHVKLKYGFGVTSFEGAPLEKRIKIIDRNFPVEIIMNQYQEVYLFVSISGSTPIKGKKYSLMNLIVWDSLEEKKTIWELCKDNYGNEISKIEFVNV